MGPLDMAGLRPEAVSRSMRCSWLQKSTAIETPLELGETGVCRLRAAALLLRAAAGVAGVQTGARLAPLECRGAGDIWPVASQVGA